MTVTLDGPRLAPASGGPARQLVVLVHGYGADGNDLIALGREWARVLPDALFVAPDGPEPCAGSPFGRQWFALARIDPGELGRGVRAAGPILDRFIDRELEAAGLDASALALVGFSQGTMMALHVGLRRARPPAAIVGHSGALADVEGLAPRDGPPPSVLLTHGDADELIPVQAMHAAAARLAELGVPVEWHQSPGTGHGIDPESLALAGAFLQAAFAEPGP
jgi:phospholipase/carboxylesterase